MLDQIAERVLAAVAEAAPELRYEENSWKQYAGTNAVLRTALGARPTHVRYPDGDGFCDLVFEFAGKTTYIEVKQAWTYMTYTAPGTPNGAYHKHLLGEGEQSALHDARDRLPRLIGSRGIDVIGMLVIALDSDLLPLHLSDLDRLAQRAGLDRAPWRRFSSPRRRSTQPGFGPIGVHAQVWLRGAAEDGVDPQPVESVATPLAESTADRARALGQDAVRKRVLQRLLELDQRYGRKWEWSAHLPSLFEACGLPRCEVSLDDRDGFRRAIHRVIPEREYSRECARECVDLIIEVIRKFHELASAKARRGDQ